MSSNSKYRPATQSVNRVSHLMRPTVAKNKLKIKSPKIHRHHRPQSPYRKRSPKNLQSKTQSCLCLADSGPLHPCLWAVVIKYLSHQRHSRLRKRRSKMNHSSKMSNLLISSRSLRIKSLRISRKTTVLTISNIHSLKQQNSLAQTLLPILIWPIRTTAHPRPGPSWKTHRMDRAPTSAFLERMHKPTSLIWVKATCKGLTTANCCRPA